MSLSTKNAICSEKPRTVSPFSDSTLRLKMTLRRMIKTQDVKCGFWNRVTPLFNSSLVCRTSRKCSKWTHRKDGVWEVKESDGVGWEMLKVYSDIIAIRSNHYLPNSRQPWAALHSHQIRCGSPFNKIHGVAGTGASQFFTSPDY